MCYFMPVKGNDLTKYCARGSRLSRYNLCWLDVRRQCEPSPSWPVLLGRQPTAGPFLWEPLTVWLRAQVLQGQPHMPSMSKACPPPPGASQLIFWTMKWRQSVWAKPWWQMLMGTNVTSKWILTNDWSRSVGKSFLWTPSSHITHHLNHMKRTHSSKQVS